MIHLNDVTLGYKGRPVIRHLSFHLAQGGVLCLTGPSGIGKSSVLQAVAGLLVPMKGSVYVGTEKLAVAFQDPPLFPWMSVEENVRFIAGGNAGGERRDYWLERLGLGSARTHFPGELSGGMKKRVGLACAFSMNAELLLLDEPLASLDRGWQERVAGCIRDHLAEKNRTLLMVSHELGPFGEMATVHGLGKDGFSPGPR